MASNPAFPFTAEEIGWALDAETRVCKIGDRIVSDRTLYRVSRELWRARIGCRLRQKELAGMMGTTASAISRLERAKGPSPSLATLQRYADVVGCYLEIRLIPRFTAEAFHAILRQRG